MAITRVRQLFSLFDPAGSGELPWADFEALLETLAPALPLKSSGWRALAYSHEAASSGGNGGSGPLSVALSTLETATAGRFLRMLLLARIAHEKKKKKNQSTASPWLPLVDFLGRPFELHALTGAARWVEPLPDGEESARGDNDSAAAAAVTTAGGRPELPPPLGQRLKRLFSKLDPLGVDWGVAWAALNGLGLGLTRQDLVQLEGLAKLAHPGKASLFVCVRSLFFESTC